MNDDYCEHCNKPWPECECLKPFGLKYQKTPEELLIKLVCPSCHEQQGQTGYSSSAGRPPEAGDRTVCSVCWEFLIFTDDGLRAATPEEMDEAREQAKENLVLRTALKIRDEQSAQRKKQ